MHSAPRSARPRAARWRVLLVIGVALGALLLMGLLIDRAFRAAMAHPPPATQEPLIVSGVGHQTTAPFYLAGGVYRGAWSAWGEAAEFPPCTHSAELMAVDPANAETAGGHVADLAKLVHVPATGGSAEHDVNVKPGVYYLEIPSECAWQISLSLKEPPN